MLTRQQVREFDRRAIEDYGVASLVLMENAGRGAAEVLVSLGIHGPVAICCGKGNNGGDGMVIARHLDLLGVCVQLHLFAGPSQLSADAAAEWSIVQKSSISTKIWTDAVDEAALAHELACSEWIVDALFGTGLQGPVKPPLDRVISLINGSPADVFAVDIPSGLDADTGEPLGATIRAKHTATFVTPKKGFDNPAARTWLGKVHVVHIGAPRRVFNEIAGSPS